MHTLKLGHVVLLFKGGRCHFGWGRGWDSPQIPFLPFCFGDTPQFPTSLGGIDQANPLCARASSGGQTELARCVLSLVYPFPLFWWEFPFLSSPLFLPFRFSVCSLSQAAKRCQPTGGGGSPTSCQRNQRGVSHTRATPGNRVRADAERGEGQHHAGAAARSRLLEGPRLCV